MSQQHPIRPENQHIMGKMAPGSPKSFPTEPIRGRLTDSSGTPVISVDKLLAEKHAQLIPIQMQELTGVAGGIVVVTTRKKRKPLADTVARGASVTITARLDQAGKYSLQLFSSSGALVESREADRSGNTALPISSSLVPGIYFVKLSHPASAKCFTQEIVVF